MSTPNEIHIQYCDSKNTWEAAISQWPQANFLQSWNWGVFHKSLNKSVYYLLFVRDTAIVGAALVVAERARRGNYLTIAGGPLFDWHDASTNELVTVLKQELKKISMQQKSVCVRIRLQEKDSPEMHQVLHEHGFSLSPMHLTADLTLQLDLTKSEEELLSEMRKNTRYEIRRADKLGLTTRMSQDRNEMKAFYEEQLAVAKRHSFVPFSYDFLQNQFDAFVEDNQVALFHTYDGNTLLASAFIIFYNKEAVYHYGVSTEANAKLPGSYACQWAAIQEAKQRGMLKYNFWGIAPENEPNHRFAGVGLFKRGFGGEEIAYVPAMDYAFSWKYHLVKLFELSRKKLRRL